MSQKRFSCFSSSIFFSFHIPLFVFISIYPLVLILCLYTFAYLRFVPVPVTKLKYSENGRFHGTCVFGSKRWQGFLAYKPVYYNNLYFACGNWFTFRISVVVVQKWWKYGRKITNIPVQNFGQTPSIGTVVQCTLHTQRERKRKAFYLV